MPIYEYKCLKCGSEFEAMQKFSDLPLSKCTSCGGTVKKLMSHSSFHLKGSGWYLTDYANKKSPSETRSDTSETKSSTDSKTESSKPSSSSEE